MYSNKPRVFILREKKTLEGQFGTQQARNQLGTPGGAKIFLREAKNF